MYQNSPTNIESQYQSQPVYVQAQPTQYQPAQYQQAQYQPAQYDQAQYQQAQYQQAQYGAAVVYGTQPVYAAQPGQQVIITARPVMGTGAVYEGPQPARQTFWRQASNSARGHKKWIKLVIGCIFVAIVIGFVVRNFVIMNRNNDDKI